MIDTKSYTYQTTKYILRQGKSVMSVYRNGVVALAGLIRDVDAESSWQSLLILLIS